MLWFQRIIMLNISMCRGGRLKRIQGLYLITSSLPKEALGSSKYSSRSAVSKNWPELLHTSGELAGLSMLNSVNQRCSLLTSRLTMSVASSGVARFLSRHPQLPLGHCFVLVNSPRSGARSVCSLLMDTKKA